MADRGATYLATFGNVRAVWLGQACEKRVMTHNQASACPAAKHARAVSTTLGMVDTTVGTCLLTQVYGRHELYPPPYRKKKVCISPSLQRCQAVS